jgi:alkaline phosphatase
MTEKAIKLVQNRHKGFFLHIESGRIDHAHHASNAFRSLTETIEFAKAVKKAAQMTNAKDTLIIVTADHSHVFTIAGYPTRGNDILGKVVDNDPTGTPAGLASDALGLPYTTLGYQNGPGYIGASAEQPEGPKFSPHFGSGYQPITDGSSRDLSGTDTANPNYLQEAAVPLGSETHAAEDVAIYAAGPMAHLFQGTVEQNVIYHVMREALKYELRSHHRPPHRGGHAWNW